MFSELQPTIHFNLMAKPVGPACNLNCTYCYYRNKLLYFPKGTKPIMEERILEAYIRQYIHSNDTAVVDFCWQGGEPCLAGVEFYRKAVSLQQRYAGNKRITNTLQTNGTLINRQWASFLKEHAFLVGISIDGPEHLHNVNRKTPRGLGTWHLVMSGIECLKRYDVEFHTLTTVNSANVHYPDEVYRFLKSLGSRFQQYTPVAEQVSVYPSGKSRALVPPDYSGRRRLSSESVNAEDYGRFLIEIFDEWAAKDVGRHFIRIIETTFAAWLGERHGLCIFSENCGDAPCIEHNGDIYCCDHFMFPAYRIGNILEDELRGLMLQPAQICFGLNKSRSLPSACKQCEFLFACRCECPKNRFLSLENESAKLNYFCSGLRMFFSHVKPYMQHMTNEAWNGRQIQLPPGDKQS